MQAAVKVALASLVPILGGSEPADRFSRVAAKVVEAIHETDGAAFHALCAPIMKDALPESKAREFFRGILRQKGKIEEVGAPNITGSMARIRLTCERGSWTMRLTLDTADRIMGLYIVEAEEGVPVPERNTSPMRLPFEGEWYVFWGGATEDDNYHITTRSQRRAVDFVVVDSDGRSHQGGGKRNEDYYCYGMGILAPAEGVVVTAIDGVPDNAPGSMNPFSAVGNCVIVRHAEREFSVLAHLQPGTVGVRPGQKVRAGQLLGRCGNSGNSSEPHLHFHLQNTAELQSGTGFAPYFKNVQVTRAKRTSRAKEHTPVRGERIRQE